MLVCLLKMGGQGHPGATPLQLSVIIETFLLHSRVGSYMVWVVHLVPGKPQNATGIPSIPQSHLCVPSLPTQCHLENSEDSKFSHLATVKNKSQH